MFVATALAVAIPSFAECAAQGGVAWQQLQPANNPAIAGAIASDAARQRLVLFPRRDPPETWEWVGRNWLQLSPATSPPSVDSYMAYHAQHQRVVLFNSMTQTWEWDGHDWAQRFPSGNPGFEGPMVYDPDHQRILMFTRDDFVYWWQWDVAWSPVPSATLPPNRENTALVHDALRHRVVLFGGVRQVGANRIVQDDTWEWDGADWQQRAPSHVPPRRERHAMAYDPVRQRVILSGGYDSTFPPLPPYADTWQWDGVDWLQLAPATVPPARSGHAMAFDEVQRQIVLFGASTVQLQDTWTLVSSSPASFTPFGWGCPPGLHVAASSLPWLGDVFTVTLGDLPPGSVPFLLLGLQPLGSTIPGLPGCVQWISVEAIDAMALVGTTATWTKAVPADVALVGWSLYCQGAAWLGGWPLDAAVSDAARAVVGMR
ncbi:MAG TPA: hypothetical protein VFZ65_08290 [Planctomycetota bacterium]|nr:hypothetical protein [Planctomycetota bacterium]